MGAKPTILDQKMKAKEWQWQLKSEVKHLDKEIKKIQADEAKIRKEIEAQAAKGNVSSVQMLAKSIVRSRKSVERLERTKASMHAVSLQLTTTISTMSTTASLKISADVMKKMNGICSVGEVGSVMEDMRREMEKCADAEDGIEEALRDEGEEEEAAVEVQRVLEEMALEKMGPLAAAAAAAPARAAPAAEPEPQPQAAPPQKLLVGADGQPVAPPQKRIVQPKPAPEEQQEAEPQQAAVAPPAAEPTYQPAASSGYAGSAPPVAPAAAPPTAEATPSAGYAAPAASPAAAPGGEDDELMARLARLKQR